MINLRFHIVSLVAVFLALALGIVTGSTLLDRVTVQQLESTQTQIERKIQLKSTENDALRRELDRIDAQQNSLSETALPVMSSGLVRNAPVVLVATRGSDEGVVRDTLRDLEQAGAVASGVIWIDQRLDVSRPETVAALAKLYGADPAAINDAEAADLRQHLIDDLAVQLASSTVAVTTPSNPTTTVPAAGSGLAPAFLQRLANDGLLDWDAPTDPSVTARTLPSAGATVVILAGESSAVSLDATVRPLVAALAARAPGHVIAGEIMTRRSTADAVDRSLDPNLTQRGVFVGALRSDKAVSPLIVTIDDIDLTYGRIALLLSLAGSTPGGRFGILPSAEAAFPAIRP